MPGVDFVLMTDGEVLGDELVGMSVSDSAKRPCC